MDGQHIPEEDLAFYAMGSLSAQEAAAIKAHLSACAACRASASEVTSDIALIGLSVEQISLPAGARERFLQRIAAEPRMTSSKQATALPGTDAAATGLLSAAGTLPSESRSSAPSSRRSWTTVLPWMLAAAMLIAAFYLGSEVSDLRSSRDQARAEAAKLALQAERAQEVMEVLTAPTAQHVMLTEGKTAQAPTGRTSYMPSHGALVFVASHMRPLPAFKAYELWIIPANGHPPMPAGTFRPDEQGTASVILPQIPIGVPAKAFGVTVESAGGSPVPTSPIILSGS